MQGLPGKAKKLQTLSFPISSPNFYCWAPVSLRVSCPWLLPPKFLCTLSLSGKTKKSFDSPAQTPPVLSALLWWQNQSPREAAVKEMKWIPAKPSSLWCATASGGGSLCQLFVCGLWWLFPKGACLHFRVWKQILTLVQSKFIAWFSRELIHEKHCAVSLLLGDHCHFLFN